MNASLGGVSGVVVDVTQSGAPPIALLATQPAGNAGAVTESKFSVNDGHGVGDGGEVAVAVGVGPSRMIWPLVCVGTNESRLSSMKMKLSGAVAQVKVVEPPRPVRNGLSSNSVPDPASGTKSTVRAEIRRILIVPGVGPGPG